MLEIPSVDSSAAAVNIATVKRYAPPNQRNRLLGRRKSVGGWTAVMSAYNNLGEDSVERPVLYTKKSASAWGQAFLPHLPTVSSGLRRDLSSELQQAMNNANSGL
ncbi:uncharacterized protein LOC142549777 isoform X4 [Primulina tabacum]|uniref:uncharacterized protein LOC142549777 isoform X4 n=1 Tax=Primulina tabacum TaxID=48773 RepID=UPI003F59FD8D